MRTVSFTRMADGTPEDYAFLESLEGDFMKALPDRLLRALDGLKGSFDGYLVTRYEHSLQAATRAHRDGRDEEYVVATLLHDIGDGLAPYTHGEMVAAILRPFVREELHWMVKHHGVFQMYYYAHHSGGDRNARDRYRGDPHFEACAEFCERYDQASFDPAYDSEPVEVFEPMVRRVFAEPRYLPSDANW
jgi:predicted HD phosphohydrolase